MFSNRLREILFRGKDIENNWRYGVPFILNDIAFITDINIHTVRVEAETLGQYTGLTDKNGVQMCEGDIVTGLFRFGMSIKAVVTFKDGAFGLMWYRGKVKTFNAFTSICNVEYEVIGNIHDNPELLGGVQE